MTNPKIINLKTVYVGDRARRARLLGGGTARVGAHGGGRAGAARRGEPAGRCARRRRVPRGALRGPAAVTARVSVLHDLTLNFYSVLELTSLVTTRSCLTDWITRGTWAARLSDFSNVAQKLGYPDRAPLLMSWHVTLHEYAMMLVTDARDALPQWCGRSEYLPLSASQPHFDQGNLDIGNHHYYMQLLHCSRGPLVPSLYSSCTPGL